MAHNAFGTEITIWKLISPPRWRKQQNDGHLEENKPHFLPLLVHSFLFKWLEAELRLQLHPLSRYYGNAIWAYQDLKPKDILDNNTIAAQPGYLRDLDLRGEIWGAADWESKSSVFLYLPHTNSVRISLLLGSVRSGTMCGIDLFLGLSFY